MEKEEAIRDGETYDYFEYGPADAVDVLRLQAKYRLWDSMLKIVKLNAVSAELEMWYSAKNSLTASCEPSKRGGWRGETDDDVAAYYFLWFRVCLRTAHGGMKMVRAPA